MDNLSKSFLNQFGTRGPAGIAPGPDARICGIALYDCERPDRLRNRGKLLLADRQTVRQCGARDCLLGCHGYYRTDSVDRQGHTLVPRQEIHRNGLRPHNLRLLLLGLLDRPIHPFGRHRDLTPAQLHRGLLLFLFFPTLRENGQICIIS